ncbi:35 exonuclease helicase [Pyrenophora tritici-repentis]|nr:35 exonuclease helicase [Pyrenophora tritici-repentis]
MQKRKPEASCLQTSGFSSSSRLLDLQEFLSPVVSSDFNEGKTKVFYSCSKRDSELAARHFLTRLLPIVAFDMQWAEDDCSKEALQKKVGLIQIATEDKVALFHLGIHPGKTSQDIIAPSLKRLIEDPKIAKVGIDIWNGHSSRLNRWFGLNPKGIVECSHLYRLVKFGRSEPKLVTTQPVSFEDQILDQLGLILGTGNSQCSFLGGTLKREEKDRAARKAYVINRLYRAMDKKRSDMRPSPPMPIYAECYPDGKMSSDDPVLLDAGNGTTTTAERFFYKNLATSSLIRKISSSSHSPFDAFDDDLSTATSRTEPNTNKSSDPFSLKYPDYNLLPRGGRTFSMDRNQPTTVTKPDPTFPPDRDSTPAFSHNEPTLNIKKFISTPPVVRAIVPAAYRNDRFSRTKKVDSDPFPDLEPSPASSHYERTVKSTKYPTTLPPPVEPVPSFQRVLRIRNAPPIPEPVPSNSAEERHFKVKHVTSTPPPRLREAPSHNTDERIFKKTSPLG